MTTIAKIILLLIISCNVYAFDEDTSITTDSNPSDVYLIVLHHGFQSHIEFAKGETVQTISLGDSYAWKITPLDNRLFIRPLEKDIHTNMTVITNKRSYQFDILSKELEFGEEKDLVYQVKFYYPKKK
jgi:type IV secretion system protein VirB9